MNKEELLAEFKRRYPVGCRFKCVHGNKMMGKDNNLITEHTKPSFMSGKPGGLYIGNLWVHLDGVWANMSFDHELVDNYQIC